MGFKLFSKKKKALDTPPPPPSQTAPATDQSLPDLPDMGTDLPEPPSLETPTDAPSAPPEQTPAPSAPSDLPDLPDPEMSDVPSMDTPAPEPAAEPTEMDDLGLGDIDIPDIPELPDLDMPEETPVAQESTPMEQHVQDSMEKPVDPVATPSEPLHTSAPVSLRTIRKEGPIFVDVDQYRVVMHHVKYMQDDVQECIIYHDQLVHIKKVMDESYDNLQQTLLHMHEKIMLADKVLFER